MQHTYFKNTASICSIIFLALFILLTAPQHAGAQLYKIKDKVKKTINTSEDKVTDASDNSINSNSNLEEAIEGGYVYYLSQVMRFDPHYYGLDQVKREAHEFAVKIESGLNTQPKYRNRQLGTISTIRNDTVTMTVAQLVDNLNNATEIIAKNKSDLEDMTNSFFVQGDVDDWKRRTDKLEGMDGFVLISNYEYPLVFNRAAGEKEALAKYSKSNGKALPASTIAPLRKQIDELLAKMNSLAPSYTYSGGGTPVDADISNAIKKQVGGNIPGAIVLKTSWLPGEWLIDKNGLDVPIMRRRLGTALYRVPNQKFCIEQHFFYHEKYAGGGKYQHGSDVNFADLRFVKCQ